LNEKTGGQGVAVVGIHRRGAVLAARLRDLVAELVGEPVPLGDIDISFYRDDLARREPTAQPVVHASHIDFPVEDTTIVLVDDVLYTGRTVRSAIDALFDYGRPERVQLAVLADRGHRELPIRPDYVGKNLPTARGERVNVRVEEVDGVDEVVIAENVEAFAGDGTCSRSTISRARTSSASWGGRRASPRSRGVRSRRCRRCAAARSSTSSTRPRRAPARASSSPPSGSAPTWST
jgi:pyrimidine operon attenuation protein/uracil phosphoribosyltransferase